LPSSTTDFTSFRKFDESLNDDYLLLYCKLNFKLLFPTHDFLNILYTLSWTIVIVYCILRLVSGLWPIVA